LLPFQCGSRHLTSILLTATGSSDLWLLEAPQKRKNRMPRVWCHIFRTRHASQSAFPGNPRRVFEVLPFNPSRALRVDAGFFLLSREVVQANGQPENSLGLSLQGLYEVHDMIWHLFINSGVLWNVSIPASP
jgi:hypothetical protein